MSRNAGADPGCAPWPKEAGVKRLGRGCHYPDAYLTPAAKTDRHLTAIMGHVPLWPIWPVEQGRSSEGRRYPGTGWNVVHGSR
jgi:hypothetical protein